MTALFDQPASSDRLPIIVIGAMLRCGLTAALMTLVGATSSFAQATKPEHHVFLIDVSGSMRAKPSGSKLSHLQIRQEKLKDWFQAHPSSLVILMSFNTDVRVPIEYDLGKPDDRMKAVEWTDRLAVKKPLQTHLWTCLEKALVAASKQALRTPGQPVTLHVLTDGLDTEHAGSLDGIMRKFPTAQLQPPKTGPRELGDFDIAIPNTSQPFSPTPSAPPSPTATVTPSPSPMATPTPSPTPPGATAIPSPRPTPTPPRGTPVSPPPSSPTLTPSDSTSPSGEAVAFEIQEPWIVHSGQFVHFINKTFFPADSYTWTVRRNLPDGPEQKVTATKETKKSEPFAYQFSNPDKDDPQSYTVSLVDNGSNISATPKFVLVRPLPGWDWDWFLSFIGNAKLWSSLATFVTGVAGLVTSVVAARSAFTRFRKNETAGKWKEMSIAAIVCFVAAVGFGHIASRAPEPQREREILFSPPPPMQPPVAQTPSPAPVINVFTQSSDHPGEVISNSTPADTSMTSIILTVLATLLVLTLAITAAVILFRWEKKRALRDQPLERSLAERLDEIKRLREAEIIPKHELPAFERAIREQLRRKYGIPPKSPQSRILPSLSSEFRALIAQLQNRTENGLLKWKLAGDHRYKTDFLQARIEVYQTATDLGIAIFDSAGSIIQIIDEDTFDDPAQTAIEINILYQLATGSALEIKETLKNIQNALKGPKGS